MKLSTFPNLFGAELVILSTETNNVAVMFMAFEVVFRNDYPSIANDFPPSDNEAASVAMEQQKQNESFA
jgi:hypothetical protein